MRHAGKERKDELVAQRLGVIVPKPPEISDRTAFWLETFWLLSPSRPLSDVGPRAIPLTEIRALTDLMPVPATGSEVVIVIRAMDGVYLEEVERKRPRK